MKFTQPIDHYLAQFNISEIRYPRDDKRMKGFMDNVDKLNALGDRQSGFIWRLMDEHGHAMNMLVYDNPNILPNITIWGGASALRKFVFTTIHNKFVQNRDKWFLPSDNPKLVMWWIHKDGLKPSMLEGVKRMDYYINNGPTEHGFGWENLDA
jgi:hypothetical protein